jgi:hypothetical protein
MLLATSGQGHGQPPGDPAAAARQLCQALPRPCDYRICARLLEQRLAASRDVLAAAGETGTIIGQEDLQMIRERIGRLLVAAADPGQAAAGVPEAG